MTLAFHEPKYQIDASVFHCHGCSREIPCEAAYFSAVVLLEAALARRDFCEPCWRAGLDPAGKPSPSHFAFWRTRRPPKPQDRPRRLRFDPAIVFELFLRLGGPGPGGGAVGEEAPAAAQEGAPAAGGEGTLPARSEAELRFFLSLLLIRRKALQFESSRLQDGQEWLILREKGESGRLHYVLNPDMSDEDLERVKVTLGELLQMQI